MPISKEARRSARTPEVRRLFGVDADTALDLLELTDFAWHDCYGDTVPPEEVLADILVCSQGDLTSLVRAAHLAVMDFRDLRLQADDLRAK